MDNQLQLITIDNVQTIDCLNAMITDLVEGWFADSPISLHDFLDRLDGWLWHKGYELPSKTDDPSIKWIMRQARQIKKELNQ